MEADLDLRESTDGGQCSAAAKEALAVDGASMPPAGAGEARLILVRRIETYPPGRRAQFAAASDEIDADKFGDYARQLRAMSPEAFHVTYAAATAAAQQTIANGVDPDFALVDFFIATLAVTDGKGWSGVDSFVHRALEEGDQELAAVAIRTMPQCFEEQLGETYGITPDTIWRVRGSGRCDAQRGLRIDAPRGMSNGAAVRRKLW